MNAVAAPNKSVFDSIAGCGICAGHKPFHFEMGTQKIMLVTYSPARAVLHRPLYYIQYFRKICLALFGDVEPSEKLVREFYDPDANIYWTHYHKCFKRGEDRESRKCEPLIKREIETLEPEIIILMGTETVRRMNEGLREQVSKMKNGAPRRIFETDVPTNVNLKKFEEIRRALREYIDWVKPDCDGLSFSGVNFLDLEYAVIKYLNADASAGRVNRFENDWINGIILPNIRAYNLILQVFIFIESNIKILLENTYEAQREAVIDIDKRWFTPFEELLKDCVMKDGEADFNCKREVRNLMEDIDSLNTLRNVISHMGGVVNARDEERNIKIIDKLKRLRGVYVYGGNSVFVSEEGVGSILNICGNFKELYTKYFVVPVHSRAKRTRGPAKSARA